MLVATCQLDIGMLLQSFDLAPYDGFLDPEAYEQWEAAAQLAAADKASNLIIFGLSLLGSNQISELSVQPGCLPARQISSSSSLV